MTWKSEGTRPHLHHGQGSVGTQSKLLTARVLFFTVCSPLRLHPGTALPALPPAGRIFTHLLTEQCLCGRRPRPLQGDSDLILGLRAAGAVLDMAGLHDITTYLCVQGR